MPDDEPIVATELLLLVHEPPLAALASVDVLPMHMPKAPLMEAGAALTVTTTELRQPPPVLYDMVEVPAETALTMPDALPMVATVLLLLVHEPPLPEVVSVEVAPVQSAVVPLMPPPDVLTVTTATA